ncbi:PqqD family protein [Oceanobacillus arenosus]|uniref:PqqD family protein n=1 Tax=Oceanobacillus arenosus TaxID=1229153 RepID=A0A3D8Q281_9BACI|nr:lasso peptide biosynthesis PqqD family chaperone [Oceanobacillus arenosus]RDW22394.1 PqqD family protein [Oceanobacillus arenosus]
MIKYHRLSKQHVVNQVEGNIVSDMDGEKVMLSIQNGKYYNLGEIGGEIWEHINQPITIEKVVAALVTQYDIGRDTCSEQVVSFLEKLLGEGLIEITERS